jgi:hypothetical protein
MTPPEEDTVQVAHKEFGLVITRHDWRLPDKHDILLDERILEATRFKLWFDLYPPS